MEYRYANASDRQPLLDFIDLVFSKVRKPHDFETLLPKAYAPYADKMPINAVAVDNGAIRGCVAVYAFPLTLNGETLNVGYVGSVSVHNSFRGQGVMGKLMEMQIARAKEEGIDMLVLGGQRQRYERFGFAPCGWHYQYLITASNVSKSLASTNACDICFSPLIQGSNDSDKAFALYQKQLVTGARNAQNFIDTTKSFSRTPWSVKRKGEFLGYIISDADKTEITELLPASGENIQAIVKAWIAENGIGSVRVTVAPWDALLNRELAAFAQVYTLSQDEMALILNYRKVISAYISLQNAVSPLSDGYITLQSGDSPAVRVTALNGKTKVELSPEAADIKLDSSEAAQLLFGLNRFYAPKIGAKVPSDWFPLPLYIPVADTF